MVVAVHKGQESLFTGSLRETGDRPVLLGYHNHLLLCAYLEPAQPVPKPRTYAPLFSTTRQASASDPCTSSTFSSSGANPRRSARCLSSSTRPTASSPGPSWSVAVRI